MPVDWTKTTTEIDADFDRVTQDAQMLRELLREAQTMVCDAATRFVGCEDFPGQLAEALFKTQYLKRDNDNPYHGSVMANDDC